MLARTRRRRTGMTAAVGRGLLGTGLALVAGLDASCVCATVDSQLNTVTALKYTRDEAGDYWQTPEETLRRGKGDCEDLALYLHRLLRDRGVGSVVVFGIQDLTDAETGHAWVECRMYDKTYVLDPTCRLMARRESLPCHRYYAVLRQPELAKKLKEYLARTGEKGINYTFEAVIEAERRRSAEAAGSE